MAPKQGEYRMKKIIILIFAVFLMVCMLSCSTDLSKKLAPNASVKGNAAHWKLKDGTGSFKVKDSGQGKLHGKIIDPNNCTWAREDDRGSFLCFSGGAVRIESDKKLLYPQGLILNIHFSYSKASFGKSNWASLLTKGNTPHDGYSVLIGKDGTLQLNFKGLKPSVKTMKLKLRENVDYQLHIALGGGKVQVYLNRELAQEYQVSGKLSDSGHPLFIGSIDNYPFHGNIYDVQLSPYHSGEIVSSVGKKNKEVKNIVLKDPPGTVLITDFSKFTPKPMVTSAANSSAWCFRSTAGFVPPGPGVLQPPENTSAPEITFNPKLNDAYDVYIGARSNAAPTILQLRLGMTTNYSTVRIKPATTYRNFEILMDRNVTMKGKKIHIAANGLFFLGYIKLIPSKHRRKVDHKVENLFSVSKEPRFVLNEAAKKIPERIKSGYFKERIYVEKRQQPTPLAESERRGYMLFNRNWMDLLFKVNVPISDPGKIILKVSAAPGEFEPVTFGVRGLKNINGLAISQSKAFQSATGQKANVKVNFAIVESVIKRNTNYHGKSEFINGPQYLEPAYPLDLKASESRQFWITLQAAPNTPAGLYRGEFALKNGSTPEKIPVELKIYPFKLDPIEGYNLGFWAAAISKEYAEKMIKDMAEHSMTSIFLHDESILKIKGKTLEDLTVDFESSIFTTIIKSFNKYGMKGNLLLGTSLIRGKVFSLPQKAQQREAYRKLVTQLDDYAHKNNGPKIFYMSYDEVLSHPSSIPDFIKEVKLQKELGLTTVDNHIWYKTSRPLQKEVDQVAAFIDVFLVRFSTRGFWYVDSWEEMIATAIKRGKKLIAYNSNNAITFAQPAAMRYIGGWFFRSIGQGCTGQMVYTYDRFSGNPYNDLDGDTDWCYIYPPYGKRKGGPSIDFESFREGADDLRYILTLEKLISTAKERNISTSDAQKVLDSIKNSFDLELFRKKSVFFNSQWDDAWTDASGKRFASGQFNLPNDWKLNDYDQARRQIADAIIQLKTRLK